MNLFRKLVPKEKKENEETLKQLEMDYSFNFPPIFLKFQSTYKTGRFSESVDSFLDIYLRPTPMYEIKIQSNNESYFYNWLSSPYEIKHDIKYYDKAYEVLVKFGLLRIGDVTQKGGIFLGVEEHNKDSIYIYIYNIHNSPIKFCNTIYDFLNNIIIKQKYPNSNYEKAISDKYWVKKDITLMLNEKSVESIHKDCSNIIAFSEMETLLINLKEIMNDVQSINS